MLTIEQIDELSAKVTEDNSVMHLFDVNLEYLCTLARERLEAGTFNEGIEAAAAKAKERAAIYDAKAVEAFGIESVITYDRHDYFMHTKEAMEIVEANIRQLKRPS